MEREKLGSRLGFILISAGCAIGIGNVWKFPYMAGQYGGGIFVLIYLLFLVILGVPVLTMEFSLGRAAQKSPVRLYQKLEKPGSKWHIHGTFAMLGNYLLMMYYTTVAGWMLQYFVYMAQGRFDGLSAEGTADAFSSMLGNPAANVIAETADKLVAGEHECMTMQYRLVLGALNALAKHAHDSNAIGDSYVMRALALAGWTPRLRACVVCGDPIDAGRTWYFSIPAGGVMCSADHTPESTLIPWNTLCQMQALVDGDWGELDTAPLTAETRQLVEKWGEYYLERPIRSLRLLD